jgi:predicted nucleotide-binding protein
MKSPLIEIEYVQNQFPFGEEEFVSIVNKSEASYDLGGWELVYEDLSTEKTIHTHYFSRLTGSFDPGERLCVISNSRSDSFSQANSEPQFPGPHWDLFTGTSILMNIPRVKVTLIDRNKNVLDSMIVERTHIETNVSGRINIFIGHGRDPQWRLLKDHLQEQHLMQVTAYEVGSRAGFSVKEVLEGLLEQSSFALLVLTGEDADHDGELHARENVVHELGLFQGRLGFRRAIALLEDGVTEFSNIYGINQIRFSKGGIRETFGDVLATIHRESARRR